MKTDELWKVIEDHPNYMISTHGNVLNVARNKLLKPTTNGYASVGLTTNGERKFYNVHRLVALAFIPNPDNKPEVNHLDENKQNNCVCNLEWSTSQENSEHSNAKSWKFVSPDGLVIEVFNLRKFCRDNGLNQGAMTLVHKGTKAHYKQWRALNGNSKGD